MSNNKRQKNNKVPVGKPGYRELARNYNSLAKSFNRVAMMAKIVTAALLEENKLHRFLIPGAGVMTAEQLRMAQEYIDSGELAKIHDLVEINLEEVKAKKVPPEERSPGDA